jgi:hypothetical protein
LASAAEAGDAATVSRYVDYPAMRDSLKVNLLAQAKAAARPGPNDGFWSGLGKAIIAAGTVVVIDGLIEEHVTPEGVAAMMKGRKPTATRGSSDRAEPADVVITTAYEDAHHFVVTVRDKGSSADPWHLIFARQGLMSWKLSAIRLATI